MKKLVSLTLVLCLIALVFSGCGGDKKDENSSSVSSGTPATVTPTPTPAPQMAKALRVTADSGLNVRAEASTDSEILGLAENGQRLALLMEDAQNGWYQVQYEGKTAYVSAEYAEVIEITLDEYNQLRNGTTSSEDSSSSQSSEAGSSEASPSPTPDASSSSTSTSSASENTEDGE